MKTPRQKLPDVMSSAEYKARAETLLSEHLKQVHVFRWAKLNERKYPELACLFAIPNQSNRGVKSGAKMKAEGLRAGLPDICLPVPRRAYNALWIEMKRHAKLKPTAVQLEWHERLSQNGGCVVVCYTTDGAIKTITDYLEQIHKQLTGA